MQCNHKKDRITDSVLLSLLFSFLYQILQHIRKDLIALVKLPNSGHDLLKCTVLAGILQLLGQIGKLIGMSGIVIDHVVHQRTKLSHRRTAVIMLVMMVMMSVVVMMLMTVLMQMVVGMGMVMVVGVTVVMLMRMCMTVVGMLMIVAVNMLMAVNAIVIVLVTHSIQNSFDIFCSYISIYAADRQ